MTQHEGVVVKKNIYFFIYYIAFKKNNEKKKIEIKLNGIHSFYLFFSWTTFWHSGHFLFLLESHKLLSRYFVLEKKSPISNKIVTSMRKQRKTCVNCCFFPLHWNHSDHVVATTVL